MPRPASMRRSFVLLLARFFKVPQSATDEQLETHAVLIQRSFKDLQDLRDAVHAMQQDLRALRDRADAAQGEQAQPVQEREGPVDLKEQMRRVWARHRSTHGARPYLEAAPRDQGLLDIVHDSLRVEVPMGLGMRIEKPRAAPDDDPSELARLEKVMEVEHANWEQREAVDRATSHELAAATEASPDSFSYTNASPAELQVMYETWKSWDKYRSLGPIMRDMGSLLGEEKQGDGKKLDEAWKQCRERMEAEESAKHSEYGAADVRAWRRAINRQGTITGRMSTSRSLPPFRESVARERSQDSATPTLLGVNSPKCERCGAPATTHKLYHPTDVDPETLTHVRAGDHPGLVMQVVTGPRLLCEEHALAHGGAWRPAVPVDGHPGCYHTENFRDEV